MTQALSTPASAGTPLVRLLARLAAIDANLPLQHFSARVARFLDMPDSITLAGVHGRLRRSAHNQPSEVVEASTETAEALFRHTRATLIDGVRRSFENPGTGSGPIFPLRPGDTEEPRRSPGFASDQTTTGVPGFSPYLRFYLAHQREFEFRISALHAEVRQAVASVSPAHARLSMLDEALTALLQAPARKFLALVPGLLARRFLAVQAEGPDWFTTFAREMEEILLAELDVRLLPTRGLLEAVDEALSGAVQQPRRPVPVVSKTLAPRPTPFTAHSEVTDPP